MNIKRAKARIPSTSRRIDEYEIVDRNVAGEVTIKYIIVEDGSLQYFIDEPHIDENEVKAIIEVSQEALSPRMSEISEEALLRILRHVARRRNIPKNRFQYILYYIIRDIFKYGIITPLVNDSENIEDILCNGPNEPIYVVHRKYGRIRTNVQFDSEDELNRLIIATVGKVGKTITRASPLVDVHLDEGRFAAILGGEVTKKSVFTFRLRPREPLTLPKLIDFGSINSLMATYLWLCIENLIPIVIAGSMSSGKTTLSNAILTLLPKNARIITVEDTPELSLPHENWIQLYPRPSSLIEKASEITLADLLKAALRHSSDYLVVGEVREKLELKVSSRL
jgi:flagellar protein FlaI